MKPYYENDGISIFHGDCREVLPGVLGGRAACDLLLTDPPYGNGFAADPTQSRERRGYAPEHWDDHTFGDLAPVLPYGEIQIIWGGNYYDLPPSRGWLAWCKPDAPPSMGGVEFAWTNQSRNARYLVQSISATNAERVGHPTQKPLALMKWCIGQFPAVRSVVDPFMGSGTTLVAARHFGCAAIGIEISERYCELAARRLSQQVLGFCFTVPDRILSEQRAARDAIAAGDQSRGARLWVADWVAEEVLTEAEGR
jgi:DNA modification methylase